MDPTLTEEQMQGLRTSIKNQLKNALGVGTLIEQLVEELHGLGGGVVQPEAALKVLQERGVVSALASQVSAPAVHQQTTSEAASGQAHPLSKSGCSYLHVKVMGGKAFTDFLTREPQLGEQLSLHVELFGQCLDCTPVPACNEPAFKGETFIELPQASKGGSSVTDTAHLLTLRQPMHIVVVSNVPQQPSDPPNLREPLLSAATQSSSHRTIHALGQGEWRTALLRQRPVVVSVALSSGPGASLGLPAGSAPAGVLQLQLSLHPTPQTTTSDHLLQLQQRTELARDSQCITEFVQRAKVWWADYVRASPDFKNRPVKVLARGEDGTQYPAPCFVQPLQLGRQLPTPRHAARWVSLLRAREEAATGAAAVAAALSARSGTEECWSSLHTIVCTKAGTNEELACLLCSLLLGFGLDAYVAVGRLRGGAPHVWVVTRAAFAAPTHWEPVTGVRHTPMDPPADCPYLSIGSLFNHQHVYANCQADDLVDACSFLLEEPTHWHQLTVTPSDKPGPGWPALPLRPPSVPTDALEEALEGALRVQLAATRASLLANQGVPQPSTTNWDHTLEYLLMPALVAYEHEAVTGEVAPGNEDFQAAIKRATPLGWVFKAVPQHHRTLSPALITAAMAADPQVSQLLCAGGAPASQATYALRTRVWALPESVFSVWVLLAVKLKA